MAKKKEYEEPIVEEMAAVAVADLESVEESVEKTTEKTKKPEEKPSDIPAGAYIYDHAGSSRILGKTKTPISNLGQTVIIGGESWYKVEDGWVTYGSKNQSTTGGECAMI